MFKSKPIRRVVGFISIISTIAWIGFSIGVIFMSFTFVDGFIGAINAQQTKAEGKFENLKAAPLLGSLPVWTENVDDIQVSTNQVFQLLVAVLGIAKIAMLILPMMIILSQIMPAFLGLQLLFS